MTEAPKTIRLSKYKKPDFTTDAVNLGFDIYSDHTDVYSTVTYTRTDKDSKKSVLVLDSENPNPAGTDFIKSIILNGSVLAEGTGFTYDQDNKKLSIDIDPKLNQWEVQIHTYLEPHKNDELSGLYKSDNVYVTQCESQGFRRITPFLDRPDVMASYFVKIEADPQECPVLLANGNKFMSYSLPNGRHAAVFNDPHPKPSYLFATANGDIECVEDKFITMSGRIVNLRVYTDKGESAKGLHALNSLKTCMKWDEDVFGREYDLDDFNIVTVSKFNAGAMENKGLNVFLDSFILANPDIATDEDYQRILDVVAHEYFHNWSGNRVTVANWFNLSLKEGLTVIREQMFTAFTTSDAVQRIKAIQKLRASQFTEDDGPLSHPVMPAELQAVDNIYTHTVYQKGAEVIHMQRALMGHDKFVQGVVDYFDTNDGKAVTINEFITAMENVSGIDFSNQFKLWYTQSGRPRVTATGHYDTAAQTYSLTLEQINLPTKDQATKKPMYIPVQMALVDAHGNDMPLVLTTDEASTIHTGATERVLSFIQDKQTFVFKDVKSEPAFHSLFRDFSAIVDCNPGLSENQLYKQLLTDKDGFNRWDASQKLALLEMNRIYKTYEATSTLPPLSKRYINTLRSLLNDVNADPNLTALMLTLPSTKEFEGKLKPVKPTVIAATIKHIENSIGAELEQDLKAAFGRVHDGKPYSFDYSAVGKRSLKALTTKYLLTNGSHDNIKAAKALYDHADNMTDKMTALEALNQHPGSERDTALLDFYNRFKTDILTVQKWFDLQANSSSLSLIRELEQLTDNTNPVFDWKVPGHVSSVFGGFVTNYTQFHKNDGSGYEFLADAVIKAESINKSTAARLVGSLCQWQKYDTATQKLMIKALERVKDNAKSDNLKEKVFKSLPNDAEKARLTLQP